MSRPKLNRVRTHVGIEQDIFSEIEALLLDPKTGKIRYGALSSITNKLYQQWLDTLHKPGVDVVQYLPQIKILSSNF